MTADELASAMLRSFTDKELAQMLSAVLTRNAEMHKELLAEREAPYRELDLALDGGGRRHQLRRALGDAIVDMRRAAELLQNKRNADLARRLYGHVGLFERIYAYLRKREEDVTQKEQAG